MTTPIEAVTEMIGTLGTMRDSLDRDFTWDTFDSCGVMVLNARRAMANAIIPLNMLRGELERRSDTNPSQEEPTDEQPPRPPL